ncbi:glycosyltransferase family 39 protein [Companilactobacillus sp.]|jgi:hypothetical protein|uniref:glycosyltransferase family 39 protein n=1 Tax=Companilactobacillus sp. TaxID=2767905 RepID=UPI0025BFAC19|nr:glycosyltransferase family 39 protein [Companilactobacillus sp.]MCH4149298.1 glycosyltransferase family 39 protein [Companilactobacillus sp.]MCI1310742.1 glycosyltransferase family 39 protein [Companilactobacillus sp.]MCI1341923.1 glycosyltransferase family 39 protein [Companilactobacillus sp.]MCI1368680.1 glycosyltransferase family 39 protein [Companilactobacillus sp.]MCI1383642.1 glycosyltransferase family 39 protein [Companilactobacillus sp.]
MTGDLGLAIFSMILVSSLLFAFAYLTASYISDKSFVFLVLVLLAIALIKVFLVLTYRIGPTSDYWNYHYLAYARASGIPWTRNMLGVNSSWPHVLNIAFLYSIPYSLIGTNFITSQILNIVITFFDGLLFYKLCASIINKQAGIFSALIFSLIPSYFLYSILNGAEPMFLTFALGLLITFNTFFSRTENSSNLRWFTSVLSMTVLSILAYMVRPTITIWLVAGLLFLMFKRDTKKIPAILRLKRYLYYFGFFAVFMVFSSLSANIYSAVYGLQLGSNQTLNKYSLATGTSPETSGAYDKSIYGIMNDNYKKYSDQTDMDKHIDSELNRRIHDNVNNLNTHGKWGIFLDQKYTRFAAEDYGYDWLLYNTYKNNRHAATFYSMKKPLVSLSVIFFEFILVSAIITMSFILLFAPVLPRGVLIQNKLFYFSLLLDGFILGSMIFEVQGRYHSILYIPLILILGLGVQILTERSHKWNLTLTI